MFLKFKLICLFSFSVALLYLLFNQIDNMPHLKLTLRKDFSFLDLIHSIQQKFVFSGVWKDEKGNILRSIERMKNS